MAMEFFFALICNWECWLNAIGQFRDARFSWRRRPAGDFSLRCMLQDGGETLSPLHDKSRRLCARPCFAFNLSAVHDAARAGVKRITPVHGAPVIPQDEIACSPFVVPFEFFAVRLRP